MAYAITKNLDGDLSLGNQNGEYVTLQPAVSDYPGGGYPIIAGTQANLANAPGTINCDLAKINAVIPVGGEGGWKPTWNPATQKLQMFGGASASDGPGGEAAAFTDLSGYAFQLMLIGN